MRKKLVVGNWKMHGSRAANAQLLAGLKEAGPWNADVAVCVPFPYIAETALALTGSAIAFGAQDCSAHDQGAYTGEVSSAMLADIGCRYVIVGHSERRTYHGETDAQVAIKALRALEHGITPIVCVGETLAQREAGETEQVVGRQLDAVLAVSGVAAFSLAVIAYEPVWAIGTGRTATPAQAQAVHEFIRNYLSGYNRESAEQLRILYGGSVKADNAQALAKEQDIDGALVGGASLVVRDFLAICAGFSS